MFGIGLPEMILIMALALIVVGPDKLPDLARSLAKTIMELKKTAEGLKDSFAEESNPLDDIRPDLEEAAKSLKNNLLENHDFDYGDSGLSGGVNPPAETVVEPSEENNQTDDSKKPGETETAGDISKEEIKPALPSIDITVEDRKNDANG